MSLEGVQTYVKGEGYITVLYLEDIDAEYKMMWSEDPTRYAYVRKASYRSADGSVGCRGKIIGYSVPGKRDRMNYRGILFYLMEQDRGMSGALEAYNKDRPMEAVTVVRKADAAFEKKNEEVTK